MSTLCTETAADTESINLLFVSIFLYCSYWLVLTVFFFSVVRKCLKHVELGNNTHEHVQQRGHSAGGWDEMPPGLFFYYARLNASLFFAAQGSAIPHSLLCCWWDFFCIYFLRFETKDKAQNQKCTTVIMTIRLCHSFATYKADNRAAGEKKLNWNICPVQYTCNMWRGLESMKKNVQQPIHNEVQKCCLQ